MGNCHYTINVGVFFAIVKRVLSDCRNLLRLSARAHARRYYQNVVARADATIGATKASKGCPFVTGEVIRRGRMQMLRQVAYNRHVIRHIRVGNQIAFTHPQRRADGLERLARSGTVARPVLQLHAESERQVAPVHRGRGGLQHRRLHQQGEAVHEVSLYGTKLT